jgi:hypothetical protein
MMITVIAGLLYPLLGRTYSARGFAFKIGISAAIVAFGFAVPNIANMVIIFGENYNLIN